MADSTLVISDRTPLLQRRESMTNIECNHGFRTFENSQRTKELLDLDRKYGVSNADEVNDAPGFTCGGTPEPDSPHTPASADIVCIFAVAFDPRAGNIVEWHLPKDSDIEGIEFRAMASGSHRVQTDFIYFKRGGLYGLACFENMPVENAEERGARMKSLGVLATNYTSLHLHMSFLQKEVRQLLESPGAYSSIETYYNENKAKQPVCDVLEDSTDVTNATLQRDALLLPLMKITHPAGCFSQFMKFFSENIFALWKMVLLKKRIIFFSPPPIGVVCYRVYCTMCLAAHRVSELDVQPVQPLFYVNIADMEHLEAEKSYIACTTEKIFESKPNLFDLYVDNQNLNSEIPLVQKILEVSPALKHKYSQLCLLQSQMNARNGWESKENPDEAWFVRYFMSLNEHLFNTLLSVSRTQGKQWTQEHMHSVGLDPSCDRVFVSELADTYGIDIVMMVDNNCCPT